MLPERVHSANKSQAQTGEGDRAVLGTSNITDGLLKSESPLILLITEPARDRARTLAREPRALPW